MGWNHLLSSMVYALADSCWMAALLWLFYQFISRLFPLQPLHLYRLGILLVSMLSIGWLIAFSAYFFNSSTPAYSTLTDLSSSTVVYVPDWLIYALASVYVAGLSYHVIIYLRANRSLQQLRKEGLPMPAYWQPYLSAATASMGIQRPVQLYLSNRVASPLTFGWLRPIILFPAAAVNQLSTEEMQAILLHELAHIKRNDFLHQRLLIWIEIFFFFNPFARLLFRQLRKEREKSCDDTVIQQGMPALPYAMALAWCARNSQYMDGSLAMTGKENELLLRISRITSLSGNKPKPDIRTSILAFVLLVLLSQFDISPQKVSLVTPTATAVVTVSKEAGTAASLLIKNRQINQSVAVRQPKKNIRVNRKKYIQKMVEPAMETIITQPTWFQSVQATDQPDRRSVLQDFRKIQQLPAVDLARLISAAVEDFNPEEQREWSRLLRKRMFQQPFVDVQQDSLLHFIPGDVFDIEKTTLDETLLQRKLLWLIWSKWQEKYPQSFEWLLHRTTTDSIDLEKNPIQ